MIPEQEQALQEHIQALAKILDDDTPPEELKTLAGIEQAVRNQMQRHLIPQVGLFLSQQRPGRLPDTNDDFNCILGLPLTSQQATQLAVRPHSQLSPYLEACCLHLSANVSYEHAAEDVEYFTGVRVARSVQ